MERAPQHHNPNVLLSSICENRPKQTHFDYMSSTELTTSMDPLLPNPPINMGLITAHYLALSTAVPAQQTKMSNNNSLLKSGTSGLCSSLPLSVFREIKMSQLIHEEHLSCESKQLRLTTSPLFAWLAAGPRKQQRSKLHQLQPLAKTAEH